MVSEVSRQDQLIDIKVVKGAEGISEFGEHWDDLFNRVVDATPFLSRPWAGTFVQEGRIRGTPLFILAWCGTKLVALLPLAVRKCLNAKIAEPIGTGQPSYLGILHDPAYPDVLRYIAGAIRTKKIISLLCIEDLWTGDSATNVFLAELVKNNFSFHRVYRNPCPYIRLGCSYEEYIKNTKSSRSRQTLRRKERHLRKEYTVDVEYYNGSEVTSGILRRIASIQQQSWMKRRGATILGSPFYQKLLLTMAQAGFARVWLMTVDGADAAFVFALVAHRRLIYAWTAFKLEYASSLSIGQFLTNWTIRDACRDGILVYDFEHGEAEYKRFWGTDNHSVYRAVAGQGVWGRLLAGFYFILWRSAKIKWLRSLYHRVKRIVYRFKQETVNL